MRCNHLSNTATLAKKLGLHVLSAILFCAQEHIVTIVGKKTAECANCVQTWRCPSFVDSVTLRIEKRVAFAKPRVFLWNMIPASIVVVRRMTGLNVCLARLESILVTNIAGLALMPKIRGWANVTWMGALTIRSTSTV